MVEILVLAASQPVLGIQVVTVVVHQLLALLFAGLGEVVEAVASALFLSCFCAGVGESDQGVPCSLCTAMTTSMVGSLPTDALFTLFCCTGAC